MAQKYLYAASVVGIQSFIFATDELKQIIGASELVEEICTDFFKERIGEGDTFDNGKLVAAAGNIRFVFEEKDKGLLMDIYKNFPFDVSEKAPGLQLVQTVVPFVGEFKNKMLVTAEENLQAQRSLHNSPSTYTGMMAHRNPETGMALYKGDKDLAGYKKEEEYARQKQNEIKRGADVALLRLRKSLTEKIMTDDYQFKLMEKVKKGQKQKRYTFLYDINQLLHSQKHDGNTWLAVIHADGNDFGKILPKFGDKVNNEKVKDPKVDFQTYFSAFSRSIDEANQRAASRAFQHVYISFLEKKGSTEITGEQQDDETADENTPNKLFFRPIILGGDDLTVVMHAPEALLFTEKYLQYFKEETKKEFEKPVDGGKSLAEIDTALENGFTACAGVAFVKAKYPMHYALELAEGLCKQAKKEAKEQAKERGETLTPAALSYYRMESSFVRSFAEITKHELKSKAIKTLSQCPYYTDATYAKAHGLPSLSDLNYKVCKLKDSGSLSARFRKVLSLLHDGSHHDIYEEFNRIEQVVGLPSWVKSKDEKTWRLLYDLLIAHSMSKGSQLIKEKQPENCVNQ